MLFAPKPEPFQSPQDSSAEMRAIPGINQLAILIAEEPGVYKILEIELKYGPLINPIASLLKARRKKRIQLEGLSLEIFNLIDGVRHIGDIIEYLISTHKLSYFESRSLCLYYMQLLSSNGIVALGIPKDEADSNESPKTPVETNA